MARKGRQDRGLYQRQDAQGNTTWYVRLAHQGKDCRFGSFPTKTKARMFYEKAKTEQHEGRFFPERYLQTGQEMIETLIDRYLETAKTKKAYYDEQFFGKWWKDWFKGQRLNAVTPQRIEEAKQFLLKQGKAPGRINRYQGWMRHVLNVAIRDGKLTINPVSKVKMLRESKGRIRFLSPEEEAKLVEQLGPTYGPYARLAILTGMRQQEQFRLEWSNVDFERGMVALPHTKAGEIQYVPLNDEATAILRSLDSWQRSKWVFPGKNPAQPLDASNFMRLYRESVIAAGIEWATWHDLRHTFASRLAMRGVPMTTIAALLRHSTTALVKRYAHLSPSYLREAIEEVSAFGQSENLVSVVVENQREIPVTSNGTGTETGNGEREAVENGV